MECYFLRTEAENISQKIKIPPFFECKEIKGNSMYDTYTISNEKKKINL